MRSGEHKAAEQVLLNEVALRMVAYGFEPKVKGQSVYRKTAEGHWAFHVSFIRHEDDLDVTADVAVRIDAIEDLVNQYDEGLKPSEKRRTTTLGAELGNLSVRAPLRWALRTTTEVPEVVDDLVRSFGEIGLPYLQSHAGIEEVYKLLLSDAPEDRLHAPIVGARYMRSLAASYLLRSAGLEKLAEKYEVRLSKVNDLYLADFKALSADLVQRNRASRF